MVLGAGIAGLTGAALLARQGCSVVLLEAHHQSGGCAGTFRRGPYTFDAGATQVAGFEQGGSHQRLFAELDVPLPRATALDPGCVVDLADGQPPVRIWRDPKRWRQERQQQFPGSERFWQFCQRLHSSNWAFAARQPVLPPRNGWDLSQLLQAIGPGTVLSGLLSGATVADLLRLCGCSGPGHQRLRRFLDLQLRLYSQEPADRTAALYGVTVLVMVQEPSAVALAWLDARAQHQSWKQRCVKPGELRLRIGWTAAGHQCGWHVQGVGPKGQPAEAADVVCSLPPQGLPALLGDRCQPDCSARGRPGDPSGALVLYGAVAREALPADCPAHLHWIGNSPAHCLSPSARGRWPRPAGPSDGDRQRVHRRQGWFELEPAAYKQPKPKRKGIEAGLEQLLGLQESHWLHRELATPRGFARWTSRPFGFVGGIGQAPDRFGPFGLASRSPLAGLWLCGDAIYPGEGTAGVSLSAEMAVRQLLAQRKLGRAA